MEPILNYKKFKSIFNLKQMIINLNIENVQKLVNKYTCEIFEFFFYQTKQLAVKYFSKHCLIIKIFPYLSDPWVDPYSEKSKAKMNLSV